MNQSVVHLVREVQRGNEDAFTQLYQEIYSDVYRIAYANCHNHHDALDITQETFITLSKSIHLLNQPETFPYWIQRIIYSTTAKYYRKQRPVTMNSEMMNILPDQVVEQKEYLPKDLFEENEERRLIHSFINELKEKHRSVIECVYLKQMSIEETSQYLNRPIGTIKSQLHVGRKELSKIIKDYEHKNHRKVEFHTLGSTSVFGIWSLAYWKGLFTSSTQLIWNLMSVAAGVAIAMVSVSGIIQVVEEYEEPLHQEQTVIIPQDQTIKQSPSFHAQFQGQDINTAQDAYYTIIKWGGTPELAKEKNIEEKKEIQGIVKELESVEGIYWDRLKSEGWINALI